MTPTREYLLARAAEVMKNPPFGWDTFAGMRYYDKRTGHDTTHDTLRKIASPKGRRVFINYDVEYTNPLEAPGPKDRLVWTVTRRRGDNEAKQFEQRWRGMGGTLDQVPNKSWDYEVPLKRYSIDEALKAGEHWVNGKSSIRFVGYGGSRGRR